jgi:hypothetical protein
MKIEQIRLDTETLCPERRTPADIKHGSVCHCSSGRFRTGALDCRSIYSFGRNKHLSRNAEIRRWKAELPTASSTANDPPMQLIRARQHRRCQSYHSIVNEFANFAAGHNHTVHAYGRKHAKREAQRARELSDMSNGPGSIAPEAEIVTAEQLLQSTALDQQAADKFLGLESSEELVEFDADGYVNTQFFEQREFLGK